MVRTPPHLPRHSLRDINGSCHVAGREHEHGIDAKEAEHDFSDIPAYWEYQPVHSARVNCDEDPKERKGLRFVSHTTLGTRTLSTSAITRRLVSRQEGGLLTGVDVLEAAANLKNANARVLDFFETHSHLIPVDWVQDLWGGTQTLVFAGSLGVLKDGRSGVPMLYPKEGKLVYGVLTIEKVWKRNVALVVMFEPKPV